MTTKMTALLLAMLMLITLMTGCQQPQDVWESYSIVETVGIAGSKGDDTTGQTDADGKTADNDAGKGTTKRTKTTTTKKGRTTVASGKVTRATNAPNQQLTFTPVADGGANYDVKGTVTIAIDTARAADSDAMFDVMMELYPNIKFQFDYWAHTNSDDCMEYLTTRMATGTAANIIWDDAGCIPVYIMNGWVKPVTSYVSKDPEAKNIPANIKEDYTFFNELWVLPHQATFPTVGFNLDLLEKLSGKLPGLEWSMDEYEALLKLGGTGFKNGVCVGVGDLHDTHYRASYYAASLSGKDIGRWGYNHDADQMEVGYLKTGATTMRKWRLLDGAEGWYQDIQSSGGKTLLQQQLGISGWDTAWATGKALMEDTMTVFSESWDNLKFKWQLWPAPNKDGDLGVHVDHCFITTNTSDANMDAAFQALRFMTYATNGNLARLTMYEDSQKGKYSLNSHVYYPVTTNTTVINKFKNLSCTDEADMYMLENIPNSNREDTFKLVPEFNEHKSNYLNAAVNQVTDGTDDGGKLTEAVKKFNDAVTESWKTFEQKYKENYK